MTELLAPQALVEKTDLKLVDVTVPSIPIDWVIPSVLAKGAVTMIAGEAGCGKSLLATQWAISASDLGKRVAIVDAENGDGMIRSRIQDMSATLNADATNIAPYEARGFDLGTGLTELNNILSASTPELLILDSWVSLWDGSELAVAEVKSSLESIRTLAKQFNCAVLLIHHTTKTTKTYRGSGAIAGVVEAVYILLRGQLPQERVLVCNKLRIAPEPAPLTLFLSPDGVFRTSLQAPVTSRPAAPGTRTPVPVAASTPPVAIAVATPPPDEPKDNALHLPKPIRFVLMVPAAPVFLVSFTIYLVTAALSAFTGRIVTGLQNIVGD